jgi:hypothetical protein
MKRSRTVMDIATSVSELNVSSKKLLGFSMFESCCDLKHELHAAKKSFTVTTSDIMQGSSQTCGMSKQNHARSFEFPYKVEIETCTSLSSECSDDEQSVSDHDLKFSELLTVQCSV